MKKQIKKIKKIASPEALFFAAFIARLMVTTWNSTMFPQFPMLQKIALVIVLSCAMSKILLYDSFSLGEIAVISIVGICSTLNFLKTGSIIMLVLLLLVVAAKGIDFKKILRIYLIVVGSIVTFAFICSLIGVIRNLKYYEEDFGIIRNSFGIQYCTDFSAHAFFLFLAYFYVRGENLKWYEYIITFVVSLLIYKFTKGDLDFNCSVIMIVLFAVGNIIGKIRGTKGKYIIKTWSSVWGVITPFAMTICCLFMYVITIKYDEHIKWMYEFNKFINSRFSTGQRTLQENGVGLFGKKIVLHGLGGSLAPEYDYNFLDCSYMYVLIMFGTVFLTVFLVTYAYAAYKNRKDMYLMYVILLISINCMIAHHLQDISYIPFVLMIMAKTASTGEKNDKPRVEFCVNS